MKIKDLIYETPEMTEEKLLEIINNDLNLVDNFLKKRLKEIHKVELCQAFLDEYDLIQEKKSLLTKSQRDKVIGFVGLCLIKMAKGEDGGNTGGDSEASSND